MTRVNSIRNRFLFSAVTNAVRAAISLAVGLLVARGLGPDDYGNLAYLLGSFWAIRALLDLGSSSAFYTFIAQRGRSYHYYSAYFAWLFFQLAFSLALVTVILPDYVTEKFWLGINSDLIVTALVATFLQNQVWLTLVQIHESLRKTVRIQFASVCIIVAHLFLVGLLLLGDWLSLRSLLWAIIAEYFLAVVWLSVTLRSQHVNHKESISEVRFSYESWYSVFIAYAKYCRPMAVIAVFTFAYEMVDRWLLQRYGGSQQQGFYQVAAQLSTISLLAASSLLNIFWKEIAEANERGEHERVANLYQKSIQSLVFLASFVSCFLAPWAEKLVDSLLGAAFHSSWPVLALMLFYPIHQTVGQINGTLFMATGRNSVYMVLTVTGLVISLPISYLLIAPETAWGEIGLGMGAMGLALKIVGLNFIFVNIQTFVISRQYGIPFRWLESVIVVLILLLISFVSKFSVDQIHLLIKATKTIATPWITLLDMGLACFLYATTCITLLVKMPRLLGISQDEVRIFRVKLLGLFR